MALFMSLGVAAAFGHAMDIWDSDPDHTHWADEHKLCKSGYCSGGISVGTVVAVWQNILYADGIATKCGSTGIDGAFGTNTRSFTMSWQNQHGGLTADGIVGSQTWGTADQYLYEVSGSTIYWYYARGILPEQRYQLLPIRRQRLYLLEEPRYKHVVVHKSRIHCHELLIQPHRDQPSIHGRSGSEPDPRRALAAQGLSSLGSPRGVQWILRPRLWPTVERRP